MCDTIYARQEVEERLPAAGVRGNGEIGFHRVSTGEDRKVLEMGSDDGGTTL